MISKVYEWLRTANLKPDDKMVSSSTAAVEDFEDSIREAKDFSLLLSAVNALIGGFERVGEQSLAFRTILDCVRKHSPAFPSSLAENALHLRIICCLGLGELLNSDDVSDSDELLASSLLVSGFGLKKNEGGRHLQKVLEELATIARANLQKQAVATRSREDLDWDEYDQLKAIAGDPATFNQKLFPTLKGIIKSIHKQQESDREELEVIWWLHNGFSSILGKQIKSATPHLAAMAIGVELADKVTPPPAAGLLELTASTAARDRTTAQLKAKSLIKILSQLGEVGLKPLIPSEEHVRRFAKSSGTTLPLTWLAVRLGESLGAAGWESELQSITGVTSEIELTPGQFASQVFVERQALRVYDTVVGAST